MHERWETLGPRDAGQHPCDADGRFARGHSTPRCRSTASWCRCGPARTPCRGLLARGRLRHGFLLTTPRASEDPLSRPHAGERQGHTEGAARQAKSHISGSCAPTSGSSLSPTPRPTIGPSWRPCTPETEVIDFWRCLANISERHPTMRWSPTGSRGTASCVTPLWRRGDRALRGPSIAQSRIGPRSNGNSPSSASTASACATTP